MLSPEELYNKIDKIREQKGLNVGKLSQLAGISHSTLSAWKSRGTYPTIDVLEGLATALNIPLAELLYDIDFNNLSADEVALLSLWKGLNDEQKNAILATIKTMCKD